MGNPLEYYPAEVYKSANNILKLASELGKESNYFQWWFYSPLLADLGRLLQMTAIQMAGAGTQYKKVEESHYWDQAEAQNRIENIAKLMIGTNYRIGYVGTLAVNCAMHGPVGSIVFNGQRVCPKCLECFRKHQQSLP